MPVAAYAARRGLTLLACVLAAAVLSTPVRCSPTAIADQAEEESSPPPQPQLTSQGLDGEDETPTGITTTALVTASPTAHAAHEVAAKDTSLAETNKGDSGHSKPMKTKKKKPMGKHKKKKQTFKDKFLPLLLIPFVIQTMLIPMFIMKLKLLAMKAMTVGKFAILLIAFNIFRSWSQNAHSTSVRGTDSLMAQNYGFNGGPEFGSFFNGR